MNVQLKQVYKSYREGQTVHGILKDVSVAFPAQRFSLILGKSGSGKSTILNLIGGIDTPDSGVVLLDERNITSLPDLERTLVRRREIGFIFQFFNLIPTLTVLENVCLIGDLDRKPRKQIEAQAQEILTRVGLQDRFDTKPDRLSGGEQQRVAIARALTHNPELILADEPTGNLDSETGRQILDLLSHLTRTKRKTLIMATHSPDAIAYADRCFRIQNFRLALQTGSHFSPPIRSTPTIGS